MEKKKLLMRSLMFVPGHNKKLINSASNSDADIILLDVEDSVYPLSNKQIARDTIKEIMENGVLKDFKVFVRINEVESGMLLQDVYQLTIPGIDGFLFSKTYTAGDIIFLDKLLEVIELEKNIPVGSFKIIPILETAASVVNADDIAKASKRNVAIGFGSEDFVSDLEGIRDYGTDVSLFIPRAWVAMVARSNNLLPIDAAYINVHDLDGLEKHLMKGKTLGYDGMWVLHPKQNELVNKYYGPSEQEIEDAKKILLLSEEAHKMGKGVAIIEGKFIGPPLVVKAKKVLEKANLIKLNKK